MYNVNVNNKTFAITKEYITYSFVLLIRLGMRKKSVNFYEWVGETMPMIKSTFFYLMPFCIKIKGGRTYV
jgi:hypothetical protein